MVVTGTLAAVFFGVCTPTFDTNDDVGMMLIADGTYFGEPKPHLVFQNPVVGLALSSLYRLTGAVNWYAIWLYALQAGALVVALALVFSDTRTRLSGRLVGVVGFVAVYGAWMWMHLQFTAAAMMVGAAGILLYASAAARDRLPYRVVVLAGTLVGLSSFVRWRSFQAVALLSVPVVLATVRRVGWRRQAAFAGAAAAVVLLGAVFGAAYYAGDDGWDEYSTLNDVRGGIHSTAALAQNATPEVAAAVGWSYSDLAMFQRWFYLDEDVYTVDALGALRSEIGSPAAPASDVLHLADGRLGAVRLALVAAFALAAGAAGRLRGWVIAFGSVVWFGAVLTGLAVFARLPDRVSVPILAFLALVLLVRPAAAFSDADAPRHGGGRRLRRGAALALGAAVAAGVWIGVSETGDASRRAGEDRRALAALLDDLAATDPDGVYVSWADSVTASRMSPEAVPTVPVTLLPLGWHQRSPMHSERMTELGISNLYLALASDPNVYLPSPRNRPHQDLFADYFAEHYGFDGVLRPVAAVGEAGSVLVFDLLVDYRVDAAAGMLVETAADGSSRRYPIDTEAGFGRYRTSNDAVRVAGFAVGYEPRGPVDHLVAIDVSGDGVLGITRPTMTRPAQAAQHGVPEDTPVGFVIPLEDPDAARVFALVGGRAVELIRVS